jgi:hypothetical protein
MKAAGIGRCGRVDDNLGMFEVFVQWISRVQFQMSVQSKVVGDKGELCILVWLDI